MRQQRLDAGPINKPQDIKMPVDMFDDLAEVVTNLALENNPHEAMDMVEVILNQTYADFNNGRGEEIVNADITTLRAQMMVVLNRADHLGIDPGSILREMSLRLVNVLRPLLREKISSGRIKKVA